MSTGPILNGYGTTDTEIQNGLNLTQNISVIHASCSIKNSIIYLLSSVYFASIHNVFHVTGEVRSGDRRGQFCGPPRPIHRSRNCSFMYSITCRLKCGDAPSRWKCNCNRVLCRSSSIAIKSPGILCIQLFFFPVALQSLKDPGRLTYRRFLELFRHMVGLLRRVISPSQGLYLHRTTQHRKMRKNIHALRGIRTHDPSNQPAKTHA
jgi:hypothetical protein